MLLPSYRIKTFPLVDDSLSTSVSHTPMSPTPQWTKLWPTLCTGILRGSNFAVTYSVNDAVVVHDQRSRVSPWSRAFVNCRPPQVYKAYHNTKNLQSDYRALNIMLLRVERAWTEFSVTDALRVNICYVLTYFVNMCFMFWLNTQGCHGMMQWCDCMPSEDYKTLNAF